MSLLSLFNQTNELFPSFSFICTGTHYGALPPMMMPNFPARASSIWWKNSWKRSTIWMKRYWCHVDWWIERLVYMFDLHFLFCWCGAIHFIVAFAWLYSHSWIFSLRRGTWLGVREEKNQKQNLRTKNERQKSMIYTSGNIWLFSNENEKPVLRSIVLYDIYDSSLPRMIVIHIIKHNLICEKKTPMEHKK